MLRERRSKQKIISPKLSTPTVSADFQYIHMPMPASTMSKSRISNDQNYINNAPIDHIITTSIESKSCNNKNTKHGLRNYLNNLNINIIPTTNTKSNTLTKVFHSGNKKHHNIKYQNLHITLMLLLIFCVFLIISLCSPDMIGIDDSFQEIYYPQLHTDNFIFVYGPLINKNFNLRKYIKFTPKSQRKNPYILHDHFDPESDGISNNNNKKNEDIISDSSEDDEGSIQAEFPVRIHHMRRGFYFDTSFNDMEYEQIIKYKQENGDIDIQFDKSQKINHSYTALGAQFDEEYDVTVTGILLRIDEKSLQQFDISGFGKAFKRETIPLQWIDFLFSKPKEFMKNIELEQETLKTVAKEIDILDSNYNDIHDKNESIIDIGSGIVNIPKEDIENANSMAQHVDIQIDKPLSDSDSIKNNNNIESDIDSDIYENDIELMDLIDSDQGVIVEDNRNINKKDILIDKQNELNVINEENTKKYQLNVWTYIVPKEIMIDDSKGQFARIMKQSYIDIVLSGCLDIGGKQFAKEFVQNTFGWTPFMIWNDDRGHSKIFKYEESFITQYEHQKIDSLLEKYVFGQRKISNEH